MYSETNKDTSQIEKTKYFKLVKETAIKLLQQNKSRKIYRYNFDKTNLSKEVDFSDPINFLFLDIALRQSIRLYEKEEDKPQICRALLYKELTGGQYRELDRNEMGFMATFTRLYALPLVEAGVLDKNALKFNSGKDGGDSFARSYLLSEKFYSEITQKSTFYMPTKQEFEEFEFKACTNGYGWAKHISNIPDMLYQTREKCKNVKYQLDMWKFHEDTHALKETGLLEMDRFQEEGERGWLYDNFLNPIKNGKRELFYTGNELQDKEVRRKMLGRMTTLFTLKMALMDTNEPQPYKTINLEDSGRINFSTSLNTMPKVLRKRYMLVRPNHVLIDLDLSSAQLTLLCQKDFCNAPLMAQKLEELHSQGLKIWDYIATPVSKDVKKTITYGFVFGGTVANIIYSVNDKFGMGTVNKEIVLDVLSHFLDLPQARDNYLSNLTELDFKKKNACNQKFKYASTIKNKKNTKRVKSKETLEKLTHEEKARKFLAFQAQGMEAYYMCNIVAQAVGNELVAFIYDGFMVEIPLIVSPEVTREWYTKNLQSYLDENFPGMKITSEIIGSN